MNMQKDSMPVRHGASAGLDISVTEDLWMEDCVRSAMRILATSCTIVST